MGRGIEGVFASSYVCYFCLMFKRKKIPLWLSPSPALSFVLMSLLFPCPDACCFWGLPPCFCPAWLGTASSSDEIQQALQGLGTWHRKAMGYFFLSFFVTLNDLFFVTPIPNYVLKRQRLCICTQLRDCLLLVFPMIVPMNKTLKLSIG